ncbi:MAG: hypothetical protein QW390_00530, partial [Candidatus Bathyarchaeia archaeon]
MLVRLITTLKELKRGKRSPLLCPRCRKPALRLLHKFDGWMIPAQYLCGECGYVGILPLEVELADG